MSQEELEGETLMIWNEESPVETTQASTGLRVRVSLSPTSPQPYPALVSPACLPTHPTDFLSEPRVYHSSPLPATGLCTCCSLSRALVPFYLSFRTQLSHRLLRKAFPVFLTEA